MSAGIRDEGQPPAGVPPARRVPLPLLAFASSLSPFGMASVLPAVAAIAAWYGTNLAAAQFVLAAYLFGLGITQPFSGALCDRLGRRPVLMGGTAVFAAATVGCALAPTLPALVFFRFVQAVGISVGTVASRAMIRDTHDPLDTTRAMATLAAAMGLAPVIGPVVGGFVGARAGPPGIFAVTAIMAVVGLVWMARTLHETLAAPIAGQPRESWVTGYRELLRSREFVGHTLLYGFIQGSFFAFLAVGAVIFEKDLGLGQDVFGGTWGLLGVSYVASAVWAGRLAPRVGAGLVLRLGAYTALASGWAMLAGAVMFGVTLAGLLVPLLALMVAAGLVTPLALAGAVGGRPAIAGLAAGLSGAVGLVLSGAMSIVAGFIYAGDFIPVAGIMAILATCTAAMVPVASPRRGRGEARKAR